MQGIRTDPPGTCGTALGIPGAGSAAVRRDPNPAARWVGAQLQTRGHKLEGASRREAFSREKWKTLLPRMQPSALARVCVASVRFSARLQGRRTRGLCALSL